MSVEQPSKIGANPRETVAEDKYATSKRSVGSTSAPLPLLLSSVEFPVQFGRYEMLRILGEGSMGAVYLARDMQLDRQVAVKIPKFDNQSAETVQRFEREARAMATLRHPNICPVYDVGQIDDTSFFTMAYIEGKTLRDHLTPGKPLRSRQTAVLIRKLALALDAAHRSDVIHRDLKPANIIIDSNNEPVIMDFGLARLEGKDSGLTEDGLMIGTPAFMSPEQASGRRGSIGPASDIYGLGAMMYEMLTGRLPFDGKLGAVLEQIVTNEPPPPSMFNNQLHEQLETICLTAMAKRIDDRFSSAGELAGALRKYLSAQHREQSSIESTDKLTTQPSATAPIHGLVERVERVRTMWNNGRYADVLPILEEMTTLTDPKAAKYVQWAREELPKAQAKIERERQRSRAEQMVDVNHATESGWSAPMANPASPLDTPHGTPLSTTWQREEEELPKWIRQWVLPLPVIVVVLLIIMVLVTSWNGTDSDGDASVVPQQAKHTATAPTLGSDLISPGDESARSDDSSQAAGGSPATQSDPLTTEVRRSPSEEVAEASQKELTSATSAENAKPKKTIVLEIMQDEPETGSTKPEKTLMGPGKRTKGSKDSATEKPAAGDKGADSERSRSSGTSTRTASAVPPPDRRLPPHDSGRFPGPGPRPPKTADDVLADLDRNNDGVISQNEIPASHRRHLLRADTNNDGRITKTELKAFHKSHPGPPPRRGPPPKRNR